MAGLQEIHDRVYGGEFGDRIAQADRPGFDQIYHGRDELFWHGCLAHAGASGAGLLRSFTHGVFPLPPRFGWRVLKTLTQDSRSDPGGRLVTQISELPNSPDRPAQAGRDPVPPAGLAAPAGGTGGQILGHRGGVVVFLNPA